MLRCGTGLPANFSHLLVALVADCFLQSGMGVLFLGDERKELVAVIEFASAATAQLVPSKSLRSGGRCASSPCIRRSNGFRSPHWAGIQRVRPDCTTLLGSSAP